MVKSEAGNGLGYAAVFRSKIDSVIEEDPFNSEVCPLL